MGRRKKQGAAGGTATPTGQDRAQPNATAAIVQPACILPGSQCASRKCVAPAFVDLSAESLRLTLLRYQAGEVSVLEVVDAQTTLVQARKPMTTGWSGTASRWLIFRL